YRHHVRRAGGLTPGSCTRYKHSQNQSLFRLFYLNEELNLVQCLLDKQGVPLYRTIQKEIMATTWKLDPTHSEVAFKVKHLVITTVTGYFRSFDGTVVTENEDDFTTGKVDF